MGTNYYLYQKPDCECCGRPFEPLHIGKSSAGWCFALHIMPEDGISTLLDWCALWSAPGAFIRDEYGEKIPIVHMDQILSHRHDALGGPAKRHSDEYCAGHGDGPWDYILGEFS